MLIRVLDSLTEALKNNASIVVFVLLCAGTLYGHAQQSYASKDDVTALKSQLSDLVASINRRALEQRIQSIESEVFALERLANSGSARQDDYERISKLRSERGSVERELRRIDQKNFH